MDTAARTDKHASCIAMTGEDRARVDSSGRCDLPSLEVLYGTTNRLGYWTNGTRANAIAGSAWRQSAAREARVLDAHRGMGLRRGRGISFWRIAACRHTWFRQAGRMAPIARMQARGLSIREMARRVERAVARPKAAKLVIDAPLRRYVQDRRAGAVADARGTKISGPRVLWMAGASLPRRAPLGPVLKRAADHPSIADRFPAV